MAATPSGRVHHPASVCSPAVMASPGTLPSARGRAGRPTGLPALPCTSATSCHPRCRRILLQREERPAQRIDRDMVEKRRQTLPWLPLNELPYPVGRLCHAFPTLRPARALAFRIPLGLGPWLPRLRRSLRPLVRRLHSYYDRSLTSPSRSSSVTDSPFLGDPATTAGWHGDLPGPGAVRTYVRGFFDTAGIPTPLAMTVGRMLPSTAYRASASRTIALSVLNSPARTRPCQRLTPALASDGP